MFLENTMQLGFSSNGSVKEEPKFYKVSIKEQSFHENESSTFPTFIGFNSADKLTINEVIDTESILSQHIFARLDSITFPKEWLDEGIQPANIQCLKLAKELAAYLLKTYTILPDRVAPSIESAFFIKFNNYENDKELIIEVYNDLDIIALVNQNNKIIKSFDTNIDTFRNDFEEIIKIYRSF